MTSSVARFTVAQPVTSGGLRDKMQEAIDDGTRTIDLTIVNTTSGEQLEVRFTFERTRYRSMTAEYSGTLQDGGIATITVSTHPEFSETAARMTLVRRINP